MTVLRLLALCASGLVFIVPPLVGAQSEQTGSMPAWSAVGGLAGLALVSFSFLYIGMFGKRMRHSGPARTLGGLLLLVPAAASVAMLATRSDPTLLWGSGILLCLTMLLFLSVVYPAGLHRRHRPLRRRERREPVLALIHSSAG